MLGIFNMNFFWQQIFTRLDFTVIFLCINSLQVQENGDDKILVDGVEFLESDGGIFLFSN